MACKKTYQVNGVGVMIHGKQNRKVCKRGEIGYLIVNVSALSDCYIGDTICESKNPVEQLPGFKRICLLCFVVYFQQIEMIMRF